MISQGRTKCGDYIYFKWPITEVLGEGIAELSFFKREARGCYSGHVGQQLLLWTSLGMSAVIFFLLSFWTSAFHLQWIGGGGGVVVEVGNLVVWCRMWCDVMHCDVM